MDIKNNITKESNLLENDSISSFMNHAAQQYHGVYEVFYNFIKDVKPKRILEIGTALGGFTRFLKICCDDLNLDTNIRSYDINRMRWYDDMVNDGIDVRVENIFVGSFESMDEEVIQYIQQEGITIVLCDGGYKKGEFNLISNYIKDGDFILAHDYAENREIFEEKINKKIWNWHELSYSDVKDAVDRNGLIYYNKETFENVVWLCKMKQNG